MTTDYYTIRQAELKEQFDRATSEEATSVPDRVPPEIEKRMKLWRRGLASIHETGYIQWHKKQAEKVLEKMKSLGWTVHRTWVTSDGWGDGMQALHAVAETPIYRTRIYKLQWCDSNRGFMAELPSGGWSPLYLVVQMDRKGV